MEENELKRYGVLGMKWGVRKDPKRAYDRAGKKLSRLDRRTVKKTQKANKLEGKYLSAKNKFEWEDPLVFNRIRTNSRAKKYVKLKRRFDRANLKSYKARTKALNWYKNMEKTFKNIDLDGVNQEYVDLGKAYSEMLFREERVRRTS